MNEKKPEHWKKIIAPVIITSLIVIYYLFYVLMILVIPVIPGIVKLLLGVIPLALIGAMIYVLIERINEIRSGEEDDLSKY
ncbi:MAG: hypothetical protein ACK5ML_03560 [Lachnospiraceae bacterium]